MSKFGNKFGRPPAQGGGFRAPPAPAAPTAQQRVAFTWKEYLKEGYFDVNGNLKIEYVSREKVEPLVQAMCGTGGLSIHQVRRYLNHCRAVESKLKTTGIDWLSVLPMVKKLDISAAEGVSKQPSPKIPELFHDFIRSNVAAIKSPKDFVQGFLPHFEALIGFGQAHFKKEKN